MVKKRQVCASQTKMAFYDTCPIGHLKVNTARCGGIWAYRYQFHPVCFRSEEAKKLSPDHLDIHLSFMV